MCEREGYCSSPQAVVYPNNEDEKYWNVVMEPFGVQILHEGV